MAKKRRKKRSMGKYTLLIGAIAFLNLIGISYGYWNDGLQMVTSITTGRMDLEVMPNYNNDSITLSPGERGELYYNIKNDSTIPVKFGEYEVRWSDGMFIDYNDGIVQVEVPGEQEAGDYNFEIQLKYYQANY